MRINDNLLMLKSSYCVAQFCVYYGWNVASLRTLVICKTALVILNFALLGSTHSYSILQKNPLRKQMVNLDCSPFQASRTESPLCVLP